MAENDRRSEGWTPPRPFANKPIILSQVEAKVFIYSWILQDFENYVNYKVGEYVSLPTFHTEVGKYSFSWQIRLYPGGYDDSCKDYISIEPYLYNENLYDNKMFLTITLVNNDEDKTVVRKLLLDSGKFRDSNVKNVLKDFVKQDLVFDKTNGFFPYNGPVVIFKLSTHDVDKESNPVEYYIQDVPPANRLPEFNDFEQLLESGKFSDFKLIVGAREFHVHKNILAARSRVFSAMFEHETTEQTDNTAIVEDIEPEVMQELLRFIYAGKVNNIQVFARDLFIAADRYELLGLKTVCEDVMIELMTIRNIGTFLHFVERYDASKLKEAALAFVAKQSLVLSAFKDLGFDAVVNSLSASLLRDVVKALMKKKHGCTVDQS